MGLILNVKKYMQSYKKVMILDKMTTTNSIYSLNSSSTDV